MQFANRLCANQLLCYRTCGGDVSSRSLSTLLPTIGTVLCYCINECDIASMDMLRRRDRRTWRSVSGTREGEELLFSGYYCTLSIAEC